MGEHQPLDYAAALSGKTGVLKRKELASFCRSFDLTCTGCFKGFRHVGEFEVYF